jgi:HPt (histidine-containing phosphotransfer) domain-containing protein
MAGVPDEQFFARLGALQERFAAGLPAALARLAAARADFDAGAPDPGLVEEVGALLHTLAGSAPTFGQRVLGQRARTLEQRLRVLTAFDQVCETEWQRWLGELDGFVAFGQHRSSLPTI